MISRLTSTVQTELDSIYAPQADDCSDRCVKDMHHIHLAPGRMPPIRLIIMIRHVAEERDLTKKSKTVLDTKSAIFNA